jgi:hypothetical protein
VAVFTKFVKNIFYMVDSFNIRFTALFFFFLNGLLRNTKSECEQIGGMGLKC